MVPFMMFILIVVPSPCSSQNKEDVSAFEDVLQLCNGGTIVVVDMARGTNPASRAWCLYEWSHTLHYHGPDGLHMTVRRSGAAGEADWEARRGE